jgi:type VI secretion system protein ImpC
MHDLSPDGLAQRIPVLAGLARARQILGSSQGSDDDAETTRQELLAALDGTALADSIRQSLGPASQTVEADVGSMAEAPAEVESADSALDSLLSKVELPRGVRTSSIARGKLTECPRTNVVELLAAAVAPPAHRSYPGKADTKGLIDEIDIALTRQIESILAHPRLVAAEAAWRGLKLLVDRVDARSGIRVEVLPTTRESFIEDFYDKVFQQEHENLSEVPLSMVLADFVFGRSTVDLEHLQDVASVAASLNVPFVLGMSPAFWGARQDKLVSSMPDLLEKMRGPEYARWASFRNDDASLWICLAANRLALRQLWQRPRAPIRSFSWRGASEGVADLPERPLWGSAVWAVGVALCQGFSAAGISFPCCGPDTAGCLDDLDLVDYQTKRESFPYPLEARYSARKAQELRLSGFAPLLADQGSDSAYFASLPTFHRPARYDSEEATRRSFLAAALPYQLFAGMAASVLQRTGAGVSCSLGRTDIEKVIRDRLLAFLACAEDLPEEAEVEVEIDEDEESPGALAVTARLRPRFTILGGEVDLMLGTVISC